MQRTIHQTRAKVRSGLDHGSAPTPAMTQPSPAEEPPDPPRRVPAGLPLAGGILALAAVLAVVEGRSAEEVLRLVTDPLRLPLLGPVIAVLAFVPASVFCVPLLPMVLAAAMFFDPVTAFAVSLAGALAGAVASFLLARRLGRAAFLRRWGALAERADRLLAQRGILAIALLRAVPVVPFFVTNYAAGLSGMRLAGFIGGTLAGLAPVILAYGVAGRRVVRLIAMPNLGDLATIAAVIAAAAVLAWTAERLLPPPAGGESAP